MGRRAIASVGGSINNYPLETLSKPALDSFAYPEVLGIRHGTQGPRQETQ